MIRVAVLVGLCVLPSAAFAITWQLDRPDVVSVAAGADAGPVLEALGSSESRFVFGTFARGRHIHLAYAGDTAALNAFLRRLAACDGVQLRLRFFKAKGETTDRLGEGGNRVPCQWFVDQDFAERPGVFEVSVFLGDGRIDVEKLELPAWAGSPKETP